jgi:hypothetical protein
MNMSHEERPNHRSGDQQDYAGAEIDDIPYAEIITDYSPAPAQAKLIIDPHIVGEALKSFPPKTRMESDHNILEDSAGPVTDPPPLPVLFTAALILALLW